MPGSAPPFQPRVTLAPNALKAALAAITQACARIRAAGKPAGILAPAVTGWLLDKTGLYSTSFAVAAAVAFTGAAIFVFGVGPLKQVEWR
jgi:hypothetical protein